MSCCITTRMVRILLIFVVVSWGILWGCKDMSQNGEEDYLVRVGDCVVTVKDFNQALEIAKSAYPHNIIQEPETYKAIRLRLLNHMAEEVIILKKARDLNIRLSDEEVKKAAAEIRKDYPKEVFEEELLESAVSYQSWEKRLRTRLIIEKVIARELKENIQLTTEEISKYYEKHKNSDELNPAEKTEQEINELIVKRLRQEKAERAYSDWIKNIRKEYTIEINEKEWENIIGS